MNLNSYIKALGVPRFARHLGVSTGYVWLLLRGERRPSGDQTMRIARAFAFAITPHEIRPDLYPSPWDGLPPDMARKIMAVMEIPSPPIASAPPPAAA